MPSCIRRPPTADRNPRTTSKKATARLPKSDACLAHSIPKLQHPFPSLYFSSPFSRLCRWQETASARPFCAVVDSESNLCHPAKPPHSLPSASSSSRPSSFTSSAAADPTPDLIPALLGPPLRGVVAATFPRFDVASPFSSAAATAAAAATSLFRGLPLFLGTSPPTTAVFVVAVSSAASLAASASRARASVSFFGGRPPSVSEAILVCRACGVVEVGVVWCVELTRRAQSDAPVEMDGREPCDVVCWGEFQLSDCLD
ncbi:hypothetical protein BT67DRAFT_129318 [Trichocladium antarcticum]|uniref:Uncharacterized protein n=1 Tax=Trichocladium antarcticum TaxID=1450529 RepID=A0AAN6URT6_9PEZI|nr:hypothetical protein BT67DRAFT_129318 [Trichocladium antarcticum]